MFRHRLDVPYVGPKFHLLNDLTFDVNPLRDFNQFQTFRDRFPVPFGGVSERVDVDHRQLVRRSLDDIAATGTPDGSMAGAIRGASLSKDEWSRRVNHAIQRRCKPLHVWCRFL